MEGKYDSYKYEDIFNYPWAISVPGSFKYPMEWQYIGAMEGTFIDGAFREEGHSFGEWAKDHNQATDWYNYPDEELIYK
jgi:hypothetical protein